MIGLGDFDDSPLTPLGKESGSSGEKESSVEKLLDDVISGVKECVGPGVDVKVHKMGEDTDVADLAEFEKVGGPLADEMEAKLRGMYGEEWRELLSKASFLNGILDDASNGDADKAGRILGALDVFRETLAEVDRQLGEMEGESDGSGS